VDLRDWITTEHGSVAARFEQSVVAHVPPERWTDTAGEGGSSIAFLAFHVAYHEDLAVSTVLGGGEPVLAEWRRTLALDGLAPHVGLAEAEPAELTAALDVEQLLGYTAAVGQATRSWLNGIDLAVLDARPDPATALSANGVDQAAVPWLYAMWAGKPAAWFIQWEAIGHRVNHVGEMVSVRNRLGLSPF